MNRKTAVQALRDIGKQIAEEWDLQHIKIQDIYEGIWKGMNNSLKAQFGKDDMITIIFHDGQVGIDKRMNRRVEIGYRFSSPRLNVFGRDENCRQTLATIELGDYEYIDGVLEHTGDYTYRESQVWGHEGYEMLGRLLEMWKEKGGR